MVDDEVIPMEVESQIDKSIGETTKPKKKTQPSYQVIGDSKIPVAKTHGTLWKSRKSMALQAMKSAHEAWDEAIRYFDHDQMSHRVDGADVDTASGGRNDRLNNSIKETENIVFSNVTTLVPALYSRNPKAEFTSNTPSGKHMATIMERLVNVIGSRKSSPGVNIKPKAKRCIVTCLLTNRAWLEVGWVFKDLSSEQALTDLASAAKRLEKAKTPKEIEKIEGEIMALEQKIDVLQPGGPFVKYKHPKQVLVDPNSIEADCTDASWLMSQDFLPTDFIVAVYGQKSKNSEDVKSIYQPTHIMKLNKSEEDSENADVDYSIFQDDKGANDFGFEDDSSFDRAKRTEVWYVWDKVTRRVYMYNAKDWSWPIWVWDDPYQLDNFFPFIPLTFYEGVEGTAKKGEVTYYLDQQDAINEIVDEKRRARSWARRNIFFNKNLVSQGDVEKVLTGPDGTARGIDIPPDMKLSDVIGSIAPPSIQFENVFDKEDLYRAIDRISTTGETLRGTQFKANTTNDAVQANVAASNMRTDEKTDQIEDWMGQVYWALAQLCLQFMSKEQVSRLIGEEDAEQWTQLTPDQIQTQLSVTVVGGSSKKPTSQAKKEEAIEVGQVIGQFASASPLVIIVALKMLEQAFDEIVIKEEDWTRLISQLEQQMGAQQQGAAPTNAPQQAQAPQGQQPQGQPQQGDIEQLLAQMPPEMKQKMVEALKAGENPQQVMADAQRMLAEISQQSQSTVQ